MITCERSSCTVVALLERQRVRSSFAQWRTRIPIPDAKSRTVDGARLVFPVTNEKEDERGRVVSGGHRGIRVVGRVTIVTLISRGDSISMLEWRDCYGKGLESRTWALWRRSDRRSKGWGEEGEEGERCSRRRKLDPSVLLSSPPRVLLHLFPRPV